MAGKAQRRLSDVAFLAGCVFFLTFGLRSVLLHLRAQPERPGPPDPSVVAALAGFLPIHFAALLSRRALACVHDRVSTGDWAGAC